MLEDMESFALALVGKDGTANAEIEAWRCRYELIEERRGGGGRVVTPCHVVQGHPKTAILGYLSPCCLLLPRHLPPLFNPSVNKACRPFRLIFRPFRCATIIIT